MTVAIIDYGAGNLRSAEKAFEHAIAARGGRERVAITSDPAIVAKADRISKVLGWQPKLNNLDTIVRHALAWEKRLMEYRAAS